MKITIRVRNIEEIDASIKAQQKAIDRKPLSSYDISVLTDTKSILMGIQEFIKVERSK